MCIQDTKVTNTIAYHDSCRYVIHINTFHTRLNSRKNVDSFGFSELVFITQTSPHYRRRTSINPQKIYLYRNFELNLLSNICRDPCESQKVRCCWVNLTEKCDAVRIGVVLLVLWVYWSLHSMSHCDLLQQRPSPHCGCLLKLSRSTDR